MRNIIILTAICFALLANAQSLYVAAPSGLKLRKTADAKGGVIKTLLYNTKVVALADTNKQVAHKTKEADGFYLNGFWELVAAGKDTGYVFDAFLLPFEQETDAFRKKYDDEYLKNCKPGEYAFFERAFKPLGPIYNIAKIDSVYRDYYAGVNKEKNSKFCNPGFTQKFEGGIIFKAINPPEVNGGMEVTFSTHNISFVYAMALSYTTYHNYGNGVAVSYKNNTIFIDTVEGAGCWSEIRIVGKKIVWDLTCGC